MNKFILLTSILVFSPLSFAKLPKSDWDLKSGKLTYHVNFPLKKVEGVSKSVKGKGHCESGQCQFLVAAPVKSFESGDGNRDNHMLESTKAALNPIVAVKVKFPEEVVGNQLDLSAEVSFAGHTKTFEHVKATLATNSNETTVKGTLPLVLTDFKIDRPSLLGVSIDDAVPVDFELVWN